MAMSSARKVILTRVGFVPWKPRSPNRIKGVKSKVGAWSDAKRAVQRIVHEPDTSLLAILEAARHVLSSPSSSSDADSSTIMTTSEPP
jgi:hypothetical protein